MTSEAQTTWARTATVTFSFGNWSFGDDFKKEAIGCARELLTRVYGLNSSRLYITYFKAYPLLGLAPDFEARDMCRKIGVSDDHIVPMNMKDNFWEMGDQDPCGLIMRIHHDRVGGRNAAHLVNQDDPGVIEIWGVVFIRFSRESDKTLRPLPNKRVDTGLSFERLVSVLQDKPSNYAKKYLHAGIGSFFFFSKIVPTVVKQIGDVFPEVRGNEQTVKDTLESEERAFAIEAMFNKYAQQCLDAGVQNLLGAYVWRLCDTFAFPVGLTTLMAEEQGLKIDEAEVAAEQEEAREASKGQEQDTSDLVALSVHDIVALGKMPGAHPTNDAAKFSQGAIQSTVLALYYDKEFVKTTSWIPDGAQFGVLLDTANFYADAGGQIFDTGRIAIGDDAEISVTNREPGRPRHLHVCDE